MNQPNPKNLTFPGDSIEGSAIPGRAGKYLYGGFSGTGPCTKPTVELPRPGRLVSEFADELGMRLKTAEIFKKDNQPVILNGGRNALDIIDARSFRTWLELHVQCHKVHNFGPVSTLKGETISLELAATVLKSVQFLTHLNPIDLVNSVRLPVIRTDSKMELLPPGYDMESRIFTVGDIPYDPDMPLGEAIKFLGELVIEFPFADGGRSLSVFISCLLTFFGSGLLPKKTVRPAFILVANAEGAGKTLLGKIAMITVYGRDAVQPLSGNEEEIRKRLLASIISGSPVVFLDNLKGHLSSPSLEAFLTSDTWEDRLLGQSKQFAGEKLSTTIITGNGLSVSQDLRRRSLWVELFLPDLKAEERTLARPMEVSDLYKMRPRILAALWALVREWNQAGRPQPKEIHASFIAWSRIIGGILGNAGYESPTLAPDLRRGGDTVTKDFQELAEHMGSASPTRYKFEDIVDICLTKGLYEFMLSDVREATDSPTYSPQIPPKTKSTFGKYLANMNGRLSGPGRFMVEGKGHSRRFYVENFNEAQ